MKNLRKSLGVLLFSGCLATGQSAYAAQADITVDVDLPTILVMYHYSTIDLTVSQTVLGDFLTGGGLPLCGGDLCDDQGTSGPTAIADLSAATIDVGLSDAGDPLTNSVATVTLQNAVGVRALGCATYAVTVVDDSTDAGVTVDTTSLGAIDGAACSLTMTTGDLAFDIDFDLVATDPISAVFDVTIAGV